MSAQFVLQEHLHQAQHLALAHSVQLEDTLHTFQGLAVILVQLAGSVPPLAVETFPVNFACQEHILQAQEQQVVLDPP